MRVIKKGRSQKGWAIEQACTGAGNGEGGCGALLLVEEADLFWTSSSHYDGSSESYITFKCVECGILTDMPKLNVPGHVRGKMKSKKEWETLKRSSILPSERDMGI